LVRIKFTEDFNEQPAVIRVIGVGGAGGNAVNRMIEGGVSHVEFIAANTDAQALRRNLAPTKLQIGESLSKGLGVGGNPVLGRQSAEESRDRIREVLIGADMVFVTAGMGGGTGTGAAPVVAQIARSLEPSPLIVGVVTHPFEFEGLVRATQAESGISELRPYVDTLIAIPNDKLFGIIDEKTTSIEAFRVADNVLKQAVQAITDVITAHGMINVDFADVRSIMVGAGEALMGIGHGNGRERAITAARESIMSPLLESVSIEGAKGVLVNIAGSRDVGMFEVREVMDFIRSAASPEAHVFYGQVFDDTLEDKIKVTVIATGFPPIKRIPAALRKNVSGAGYNEREKDVFSIGPKKQAGGISDDLRRPAYLRWRTKKLK